MGRPRRAPSLHRNQLRSQLVGEARAKFVLHVKEIGDIGLSNRSAQRWLPVSASMS